MVSAGNPALNSAASSQELDLIFSALANPIRRSILAQAHGNQANVTTLAKRFNVSLPAITRHLNVLREAGLVAFQKQGRDRQIKVEVERLQSVTEWIEFYTEFWNEQFSTLEAYLTQQSDDQS